MKVNLSTKLICIDEYRLLLKNLGEEWLSLRSVEIHRTFFNNENQKHAFIHLPNIVRIGQLCRLASMMRRRESLGYDQARRLALYLDMQPDTFDVNINAMEGLGWVKRNPNMVLEEFIPTLPVVLSTMGRLYRSPERELPVVSNPSDVELASLNALDLWSAPAILVNWDSDMTLVLDCVSMCLHFLY